MATVNSTACWFCKTYYYTNNMTESREVNYIHTIWQRAESREVNREQETHTWHRANELNCREMRNNLLTQQMNSIAEKLEIIC